MIVNRHLHCYIFSHQILLCTHNSFMPVSVQTIQKRKDLSKKNQSKIDLGHDIVLPGNDITKNIKSIQTADYTYMCTMEQGAKTFRRNIFSFSSRWHRSTWKGPYVLCPVSQQSTQGCPRNSANICLFEHRSFSTSEGGMSAASFLHSSFLQAISAVMLWPVHVQKVSQASEHLCPAKLQTKTGVINATPTN